jgi:hypothetical protein
LKKDGQNGIPNKKKDYLMISNVSSLDLNASLSTNKPFYLINNDNDGEERLVSKMFLNIQTGDSIKLAMIFDTSFKNDLHNEKVDGTLDISYAEHQNSVIINLICGRIKILSILKSQIVEYKKEFPTRINHILIF